jgi:glycosyltransferase involved in cell wall biosynthesis
VYSIAQHTEGGPGSDSGPTNSEDGNSSAATALIAVVVPTRNELGSVAELHRQLGAALTGRSWEVVFVDDSDDGTTDALRRLSAADDHVRVVHRPPGRRSGGLGGAVLEGFAATTAGVLVVMDGDLQHPPEAIPRLVDTMTADRADIVVATRYRSGGSAAGLANLFRVQASRGCRRLVHAMLPATRASTDPLGGFFALRRAVVAGVDLRPHGYKILLEILVNGNWTRLRDVEYAFRARLAGESKSGVAEARRFLTHVRMLRRGPRPHRPPPPSDRAGLRILVFTSEVAPVVSGIATSMGNLSRGLTAIGHHVEVVSRTDFPRLVHRELRLSAFVLAWPRFRRRLAGFDVVNVHGPVPTMSEVFLVLAALMRGRNRPAVVYTHHSDLAIPGLRWVCAGYNRLHRRIARLSDTILVSTAEYREKLGTAAPVPIEIIPWGVDAGRVVPRQRRPTGLLRVLFVGQLRPYKGARVLVDAVQSLRGVTLTVIGDGPEAPLLQDRAEAAAMTNIEFAGRVSDEELWLAYSRHDVVVLPSLTTAEAYGLVLGEGMAAGCVPVASDLPGVREVVGDAGLLVPAGDVAALREALAGLATDAGLMPRLAARCRDRARSMSVEAATIRHDEVFRRAVERRAGARHRSCAERPGADRPGADRPGAERPGADRPGADRPARSDRHDRPDRSDLEEIQCPAC